MKYVFLSGKKIQNDIGMIIAALEEDPEVVFVFTHPQIKLFAYIDSLKSNGLSNDFLYNFKVCYEKQNLDLTYFDKKESEGCNLSCISQLIEKLDKTIPCRIIVNHQERTVLADIVQQLIYIGYPVSSVNILMKSEAKDEERIKRFMDKSNDLSFAVSQSVEQLEFLKKKYSEISEDTIKEEQKEFLEKLEKVIQNCETILENLEKAKGVEMKIAVAASKKTGKSMIINSMLGEELAPTSLELATPNTCIYKKSEDEKYHLFYKKEESIYDTAEELYSRIDTEFKKAQEDQEHNYKMEDMEIAYVTEGNRFESFTVFDTPGPDAAGMDLAFSAVEAIKKCDVAIFAIDFTKHLTTSEEAYLRKIKEEFTKSGKFLSLIFVINKMDTVYTDTNTAKSTIKSIDYIRNRLGEINSDYKDCIIFATSALQYFRTIECEKGCGRIFSESNDLYSDIRPIKKRFPKYREQLAWLDGQVGFMDSCHNIIGVTAKTLKQRSGIPDLLNYVSYVICTKAREEIINNVAAVIDMQIKQLQSVIDYTNNIEQLIHLNQDQINSITEIINEFKKNTDEILMDRITEADLALVTDSGVIESYAKKAGGTVGFEAVKQGVTENIRKNKENLPSDLEMTDQFFKVIQDQTYRDFVEGIREKTKGGKIEKGDLDAVASTLVSEKLLKKAAEDVIGSYYGEAVLTQQQNVDQIKTEIEEIINKRLQQIEDASEECRKKLEKYARFHIPEIPDFTFGLPKVKNDLNMNGIVVSSDIKDRLWKLRGLAVDRKMNWVYQLWRNFLDKQTGRVEYYTKEISEKNYKADFKERFYASICDLVRDNVKFQQCVKDGLDQVVLEMEHIMDKFDRQFSDMSDVCKENIKTFTTIIDDREKYYLNNESLERQKMLIQDIYSVTKEFFEIWDYVLSGEGALMEEISELE